MTGEKVTDLDAIRVLEAAATPGPWVNGYDDASGRPDGENGGTILALYAQPVGDLTGETVVNGGRDDWGVRVGVKLAEDAEFIAAARTAVPDLLARNDDLEAKNADLLALLDEAVDLLLDVYTAKGNEDWFDRRDTFLARFPAPSPTDEEMA